jgi:hypothetical protein
MVIAFPTFPGLSDSGVRRSGLGAANVVNFALFKQCGCVSKRDFQCRTHHIGRIMNALRAKAAYACHSKIARFVGKQVDFENLPCDN